MFFNKSKPKIKLSVNEKNVRIQNISKNLIKTGNIKLSTNLYRYIIDVPYLNEFKSENIDSKNSDNNLLNIDSLDENFITSNIIDLLNENEDTVNKSEDGINTKKKINNEEINSKDEEFKINEIITNSKNIENITKMNIEDKNDMRKLDIIDIKNKYLLNLENNYKSLLENLNDNKKNLLLINDIKIQQKILSTKLDNLENKSIGIILKYKEKAERKGEFSLKENKLILNIYDIFDNNHLKYITSWINIRNNRKGTLYINNINNNNNGIYFKLNNGNIRKDSEIYAFLDVETYTILGDGLVINKDYSIFFVYNGNDEGNGLIGSKGEKGEIGIGLKGEIGIKGENGQLGLKGEKGDIGPLGIQGIPGIGEKGIEGFKGDKGDIGKQGIKGDKGISGEAATKGEKGLMGYKGNTGEPGQKGSSGIGIKGDMGEGYSYYIESLNIYLVNNKLILKPDESYIIKFTSNENINFMKLLLFQSKNINDNILNVAVYNSNNILVSNISEIFCRKSDYCIEVNSKNNLNINLVKSKKYFLVIKNVGETQWNGCSYYVNYNDYKLLAWNNQNIDLNSFKFTQSLNKSLNHTIYFKIYN